MFKDKFQKDVLKALIWLCILLGLCKVTAGAVVIAVMLLGVVFAIQRKAGLLAVCYLIATIFVNVNHAIVPLKGSIVMLSRIGGVVMVAAMMLASMGFSRRVRERLPILWLFVYCLVALVSSLDGWMPLISLLKLVQYVLFLVGLIFITRIMQKSDSDLYLIRCVMMAFAIVFIFGSVIVYFIPSVGYSMHLDKLAGWGLVKTGDELLASGGLVLFNGMTAHSQMLAPVTAIMCAWVLCDMILVERRMTLLHCSLITISPVLVYLSRSRGGLLELVAVLLSVILVCVPRARLAAAIRGKFRMGMVLGGLVLLVVAGVAEAKNNTISRWIRKSEDVRADKRTLGQAFMESRQLALNMNLRDFRLNPLFGKGFQVMPGMEQLYRWGYITLFSAPVEKGVTPYVVLGETGLCGAVVFVIFLLSFYSTCLKRRYLALLTMFTCMMVANLADSTFFSPGGGGFFWITSCVGGLGIDFIAIRKAHGVWTGPDGRPDLLPGPMPFFG